MKVVIVSLVLATVLFAGCIRNGDLGYNGNGSENKSTEPGPVKEEFCGRSTLGECASDSNCLVDGCSGQICRSDKDERVITTCEWRECYNAQAYGLECRCIRSKCQWAGS